MFDRVAQALNRPCASFRFRIEHAQHIAPNDIARFGTLGVIASLQMSHLADDGCWATNAIGARRMATSWPFKSLIRNDAKVCSGSDWFVTVNANNNNKHTFGYSLIIGTESVGRNLCRSDAAYDRWTTSKRFGSRRMRVGRRCVVVVYSRRLLCIV